jgi:hypothetical protein
MENLKIRITLSNGKGWRETQIIQLSHYLLEKEKGNHLLDEILEKLIEDESNMVEKIKDNKTTYQKWRP